MPSAGGRGWELKHDRSVKGDGVGGLVVDLLQGDQLGEGDVEAWFRSLKAAQAARLCSPC
jgi:hypothetical protein